MIITKTLVKNFRNYSPYLSVNWEPGINLILGKNGAGKTNLLESLSILSGWGAFGKTRDVINWSNNYSGAQIFAKVSGEESFTVSAEISSRISLRLADKAITSTDMRLALPSLLFLTSNNTLIDGSPSARRMFIDRLCALFVPPFARKLAEFKTIQRKRVSLLRRGKSPDWTDILFCSLGGYVMDIRRRTLSLLSGLIPEGKFSLAFVPELNCSPEEYLHRELERTHGAELRVLRPLTGPSYDDIAVTVGNMPAYQILSRGQKRRLVLYMTITAGKLIAQRLGRNPILLFDDLTAELDKRNRELAYRELAGTKWQVFITAPEKPFMTRKKFGGINIA